MTLKQKTKTIAIMAAGMGSRYGGLKQMDIIGPHGEFLIDYTLYDAWLAGFQRAVLIIKPEVEKAFRKHLASRIFTQKNNDQNLPPLEIDYAPQTLNDLPTGFELPATREKPWGTGHALRSARHLISGPFVVCSADDYYGPKTFTVLSQALDEIADQKNSYVMVAHRLGETLSKSGSVSRGLCKLDNYNYLTSIHEHTHIEQKDNQIVSIDKEGVEHPLEAERPVSMAIFAFTPDFFSHLEKDFLHFLQNNIQEPKMEFFTPNVINHLLENKTAKIKVYPLSSPWFGLTNRQDKEIAVNKIADFIHQGQYPEKI